MKYTALQPIKSGGRRFAPGEQVELSDKAAADLLALSAIEPVAKTAKATKAAAAEAAAAEAAAAEAAAAEAAAAAAAAAEAAAAAAKVD